MKTTKNAYLAKLTEQIQMKSVNVGKNLEGTTPPSVFIGRWSYPKVYAGPMMSSEMGDTYMMDSPESWIGQNKTQDEHKFHSDTSHCRYICLSNSNNKC